MNGSNSDGLFYISRNNSVETYCLLNILLYIILYRFTKIAELPIHAV